MKVLGLDGNWSLHRMHSVVPERCVDLVITALCNDALANRATHVIVAIDGNDVFRHKLYSDYKVGRQELRASRKRDPYEYLPDLKAALDSCGIPHIQLAEYEADDILCSLATQFDNVAVSCKDKDHLQYLRPGVVLYDSSVKLNGVKSPKTTTHLDVKKAHGIESSQFVEYQTLIGDSSDKVPRLLSPAKAKLGLSTYGTITRWMKHDPDFKSFVLAHQDQIKRNHKLVKLVDDIPIEVKPIAWSNYRNTAYIKLKEALNPKSKGLF